MRFKEKIETIDFIGIGAPRSGTSWLSSCLRAHPQICFSEPKEIRYFNKNSLPLETRSGIQNKNHQKSFSWYLNHFQHHRKGQICGEFSPIYLYDSTAPIAIKRQLPNVKLIVCLRNPIDRTYSHYWLLKGLSLIGEIPFEKVVQEEKALIEMGFYSIQLSRYFKYFKREQFSILLTDEILDQPEQVIKRVLNFLNVDPEIDLKTDKKYKNAAMLVKSKRVKKFFLSLQRTFVSLKLSFLLDFFRSLGANDLITELNTETVEYPEMSPDTRNVLRNVFREDIANLETLLNIDLSHWK